MSLKIYTSIILLFLSLSRSFAQDHLEPEEGMVASSSSIHMQYQSDVQKILMKKLSSYPLFRMVCLPSFDLEWVVELEENEAKEYSVAAVIPEDQIWSSVTLRSGKKPLKPEGMRTKTFRTKIDSLSANRIYRVIQTFLAETRFSTDGVIGLDGVNYHFSSWRQNIGTRFGKTWSPDKNSKTYKLVSLGKLLYKYATIENRDNVGVEINALLTSIEN